MNLKFFLSFLSPFKKINFISSIFLLESVNKSYQRKRKGIEIIHNIKFYITQIEHANTFTIPNAVSDSSFIAIDPSVLLSQ